MNTNPHVKLLGHRVQDKITGIKGVVTSVSFDLYGCIQAYINRGLDKDGKWLDSQWFDIARLTPLSTKPVMVAPDFGAGPIADGDKGPESKPLPNHA